MSGALQTDRRLRRRVGALFAATMGAIHVGLAAPPAAAAAAPTTVVVEGRTDPGQPLTLVVVDAAGNVIDDPSAKGATTAGPDGAFRLAITPADGATPGSYTAVVTRSNTSSEVQRSSFTIPSPRGERLTVSPGATTVGVPRIVRGEGFQPGVIEYGIYGKAGQAFGLGEAVVTSTGTFEVVVPTDAYAPGKYMVYTTGAGAGAGAVASAVLTVEAPVVTLMARTAGVKGGHGTISLVSPLDSGGAQGASWDKSFAVGTEVQVIAQPADRSFFVDWTVDGAFHGRSFTLNLTVTTTTTVTATFEGEFRAVDVASTPTGAAFAGEGGGLFAIGTDGAAWTWGNDYQHLGWRSLGGTSLQSVVSTWNPAGGGALFAIDSDGHLMHAWEQSQGWRWTDLSDGTETPAPIPLPVMSVVATQNPTGGLAVFAIGGDGRIWHAWQDYPAGPWVGWSDVSEAPETPAPIPLPVKSVVATQNPSGGLAIFAIGGDGRVWHAWQDQPKSAWVGWSDISGPPDMQAPLPVAARSLVVGHVFDGGLDIVVLGEGNRVWYASQSRAKGAWIGWEDLGGDSIVQVASRSSPLEIDGNRILARGPNGEVWTRSQQLPKTSWGNWYRLKLFQ